MTLEMASLIFLLMGFDRGENVRHYWMICDPKMLHYCGISKGLVS
jgi:hypothetical protein